MPLPAPESSLAADPATKLRVPHIRKPRRRMFRRLRCNVPGYVPICCDTNDPDTQVKGLTKRLLRDVPRPDPELLIRLRQFVRAELEANYKPASERLSFEQWLADAPYPEARKEELRRAHEDNKGGRPSNRRARRVKCFGKTEPYAEYKFMRWICARGDHAKVYLGPLMKMVEKAVFCHEEFIKTVPVPERPAMLEKLEAAGLRYFLTDFTAFESHFVPEIMRALECELYRYVWSGVVPDEEIEWVINLLSGDNHLGTRLGVRAIVRARRMSGEMSTSVANGFSNLMLAKFIASIKNITLKGYVEGDDGIFATDGELTASDYERLGWTIKIVEVTSPRKMTPVEKSTGPYGAYSGAFCGILCSEDNQIIRDPRAFLASFGWSSNCIDASPLVCDQLLRAKALSACHETPSCPVVGALARRALQETKGVTPRWVYDGYHQLVPTDEKTIPPFSPTLGTRLLFEEQFGVGVEEQLEIESRFEQGRFDVSDILLPRADMAHYESRFVERG